MADVDAIRALKLSLKMPTESEAVRISLQNRLALEEAQAAFQRIRTRGGIDDIFQRSAADTRKKKK